MTLTDYYKGEILQENKAQCRFEITQSTLMYDFFQKLLINKRKPNVGGWSFYFVKRPQKWRGKRNVDHAITKGNCNISSIYFPNPNLPFGYGDIQGTMDACLICINPDFKERGITTIELFISRENKVNQKTLCAELICGKLNSEIDYLREISDYTKPIS